MANSMFTRFLCASTTISLVLCPFSTMTPSANASDVQTPAAIPIRLDAQAYVVGSGSPSSCTTEALTIALNSANEISFNCGSAPTTIIATAYDVVNGRNITINGSDSISLSGENERQLFRIRSGGRLSLQNIIITGGGGEEGGAVQVDTGGTLEIIASFFDENGTSAQLGGAISSNGLVEVQRSSLRYNKAGKYGGAIHSTGILLIEDSYLHNNNVLAPIGAIGGGGAIASFGELQVSNSTLSRNRASLEGGAVLVSSGSAEVINSTVHENYAAKGAGIFFSLDAESSLLNTTIDSNNSDLGANVWNDGGTVTVANTIIANGSTEADVGISSPDCGGVALKTLGNNVISDDSCLSTPLSTDQTETDPKLMFLGDNGGHSPTVELQPDSPAIDSGNDALCPAFDQRGVSRPQGHRCDVGALEALISTAHEPVIFIPGVAGSVLEQQNALLPLWPNVLAPDEKLATVVRFLLGEKGLLLEAAAKLAMGEMAGKAADLKLDPNVNWRTYDKVYAPDVIRWIPNSTVRLKDVYGSFLEQFANQGYREYAFNGVTPPACSASGSSATPNLFVFPYDWRLPIDVLAERLAEYIDGCVRHFHPTGDFNIVAHSMGGMVARRYVLDKQAARQPHGIHRMITMGSPWLGAPKFVNVMLNGDFDVWTNLIFLNRNVMKELVATYPGAFELGPSQRYFERVATDNSVGLVPPVFGEDGWDINEDGVFSANWTYDDFKRYLDGRYSQFRPVQQNESLHGQPGQDVWSGDSSGIEYHHIIGSKWGTIGGVVATRTCLLGNLICNQLDYIAVNVALDFLGDGTVPQLSSKGSPIGAPPSAHNQFYHDFWDPDPVHISAEYEHGALPNAERVRDCIFALLRDEPCLDDSNAISATQGADQEGYVLQILGVDEALVTDKNAMTSGMDDGVQFANIPGVEYLQIGDHAIQLLVGVSAPLTLTFTAGDAPASIEVLHYQGDTVVKSVRYNDLVLEANRLYALSLPLEAKPLWYDANGDGLVDEVHDRAHEAIPNIVEGSAAQDTTAPVMSFVANPDGAYAITASDATGVERIYFSLDGEQYEVYRGTIPLTPTTRTIYAFADDLLGNRSGVVTLDVGVDVYLPAVTH